MKVGHKTRLSSSLKMGSYSITVRELKMLFASMKVGQRTRLRSSLKMASYSITVRELKILFAAMKVGHMAGSVLVKDVQLQHHSHRDQDAICCHESRSQG